VGRSLEKVARNLHGVALHYVREPVTEIVPDRWSADRDLAQRCARGDRAAQRELYEREKRRVHATLYRIFGTNRHIDDVIQEAFLQVFRSLGSFRGESSLATWIDRCAVRAAFAHLSKTKRSRAELELVHDVPSNDPSAERRAHAREATRRLYRLLDDLEPKQRLAFVLQELEGNSLAAVAEMMDATVVATKARVFRARQRIDTAARKDPVLRGFLEGEEEEGEAS